MYIPVLATAIVASASGISLPQCVSHLKWLFSWDMHDQCGIAAKISFEHPRAGNSEAHRDSSISKADSRVENMRETATWPSLSPDVFWVLWATKANEMYGSSRSWIYLSRVCKQLRR